MRIPWMSNPLGLSLILALTTGCAAVGPDEGLTVEAKKADHAIEVYVGGELFTAYKFGPTLKKPYLYPVNGPRTGKSVTTESSEPYPHHNSIFFGCDKVSGGNYWQAGLDRGQILSKGAKIVRAKGKNVVIEDHTRWHRPGAPDPFHGKRVIEISAPLPRLRYIDFTVTLTAQSDVHIAKSNHALFSARMAPHMSVKSGGRLVNAEGHRSQKGTLGKKSVWCDYSNKHHGHVEGLAILDWPENRWTPCTWLTRDYGFFSPTPMNWLGPEGIDFKRGEMLTLRYRVVVHAGNEKEADIARLYDVWTKAAE